MKEYINFHRHDSFSNIVIADSPASIDDYIIRAKELGHTVLTSTNHGVSAGWTRLYLACEKANIKFVYAVEPYIKTTEGKPHHIIMIAKNKEGMEDINDLLSEAAIVNFSNRRPYITVELIKQFVKPENVMVTTACIAGILKEESLEMFHFLRNYFKDNFFIEVQSHNVQPQIDLNIKAQLLGTKYNIPLIAANDTHYIYSNQSQERDDLLAAKRISYGDEEDDESGWYMDYPDYDTMFNRFMGQGIWTKEEVEEIIDRTIIIKDFDDIVISKELRVPTLYKELSPTERKKKLAELIQDKWNKYKVNVIPERHKEYEAEIVAELKEWFACHMEDYALTSYVILEEGKKNGGLITRTGRGSASSYITNMLLGFTTVDRLKVKVPLLMSRFMTADKVIKGHTTPDIDNNIADTLPFVKAQEDLLGEWRSAPLVAFGTTQAKSAFKMMCKANGNIPVEIQNEMTSIIDKFDLDYKHASDEDRLDMKLEDYIESQELLDLYKQGEKFFGMITDSKKHASAYCISNINLRREFGMIKTPKGDLVLNLEGQYMDTFGLVKLDWLIVDVVSIINNVYNEIGIPVPTADELSKLVEGDEQVWSIYERGLTTCVNQVEKAKTKQKVMRYKPKTIEELTAFISGIRPGFQSYYNRFENREEFSFGLKELDDILQGEFLDSSYMMYQEQIMLIFMWLGFEMKVTYDIMKAISKKKEEVIKSVKPEFEKKCMSLFIENGFSEDKAIEETAHIWKLIEDNSKYSFNASHGYNMACDSLYIAYAKAYYPNQTIKALIDYFTEKKKRDKVYQLQIEAEQLGVTLPPLKFRQDNRSTTLEGDTITTALKSVKTLDNETAEIMYKHRNFKGSLAELIILLWKEEKVDLGKLKALSYIGYFEEFGSISDCIWILDNYKTYKQLSMTSLFKLYDANEHLLDISLDELVEELRMASEKFTEKTIKFEDELTVFKIIYSHVKNKEITELEKLYREVFYLGTIKPREKNNIVCTVTSYKGKKSALLDDVVTGNQSWYTVGEDSGIKEKDIIYISSVSIREWKGREFKTANRIINLTKMFGKVIKRKSEE